MKIYYDDKVDAAYIELSKKRPYSVTGISDYLNLDIAKDGEIFGIELITVSKKIQIKTLFNYELDSKSLNKEFKKPMVL